MAGFFRPEEEIRAAEKTYEAGRGEIEYLNFIQEAVSLLQKCLMRFLEKNKEMHVIPEAGQFDLYDLAPYGSEALELYCPVFRKES